MSLLAELHAFFGRGYKNVAPTELVRSIEKRPDFPWISGRNNLIGVSTPEHKRTVDP